MLVLQLSRLAHQHIGFAFAFPGALRHISSMSSDFYAEIHASSSSDLPTFKYYCNGQWLESSSGKHVPVTNPSTLKKEYLVQGE
jgi:hypothetical protein